MVYRSDRGLPSVFPGVFAVIRSVAATVTCWCQKFDLLRDGTEFNGPLGAMTAALKVFDVVLKAQNLWQVLSHDGVGSVQIARGCATDIVEVSFTKFFTGHLKEMELLALRHPGYVGQQIVGVEVALRLPGEG